MGYSSFALSRVRRRAVYQSWSGCRSSRSVATSRALPSTREASPCFALIDDNGDHRVDLAEVPHRLVHPDVVLGHKNYLCSGRRFILVSV